MAASSSEDALLATFLQVNIPTATVTLMPGSNIQNAIDSLTALGGGTIVLASGTHHNCGSITLRDNINLHLDDGATLLFCGHPQCTLPPVMTRWEGTELYGRRAMLRADGATNIAITGRGIIDANGAEMARWGMAPETVGFEENIHGTHGETIEMPDVRRLRKMGADGIPLEERVFADSTHLRPCAIELRRCSRVLIDGITLRNSPFWCIHPLYADNVVVRNVHIDSHFPNNDGCDPESSRNILIEDCTFHTGDDAVAIKAGRDADGRRVGIPTENVVIRRCRFFSKCNGLCIGSEMSGGVRNVIMHDVEIGTVKNALLFKSNLDRGGYIRDVCVRNIRIDEAQGAVLRFETNYFGYNGGNCPPQYERFDIADVYAEKADGYAIYFDGPADASSGTPVGKNTQYAIRDISVRNMRVDSALHPCYLYNTERCTFQNTIVNGIMLNPTPPESLERQSCDVW